MDAVYSRLGSAMQQVGGDCPAGWIVMESIRPTDQHIAQEGGKWVPVEREYKRFSVLDFFDLLKPERRAIKVAVMNDVDVGIWYDDAVAADYVTYSDPRVSGGLEALLAAGLLTADRLAEVVAAMTAEYHSGQDQ